MHDKRVKLPENLKKEKYLLSNFANERWVDPTKQRLLLVCCQKKKTALKLLCQEKKESDAEEKNLTLA